MQVYGYKTFGIKRGGVLDVDVGVEGETCKVGEVFIVAGDVVLHLDNLVEFLAPFEGLDFIMLLCQVVV